jgi:hypothetical protein
LIAGTLAQLPGVLGLGLFCRCDEGFQLFDIFSKHRGELDAVADLGVAGDDGGLHQQGAVDLEFEIEERADGKGKDGLDVAAVEAEVGGGAANWKVTALRKDLDGNLDLDALNVSSLPGLEAWRKSPDDRPAQRGEVFQDQAGVKVWGV